MLNILSAKMSLIQFKCKNENEKKQKTENPDEKTIR